jgi:hypothetical protein
MSPTGSTARNNRPVVPFQTLSPVAVLLILMLDKKHFAFAVMEQFENALHRWTVQFDHPLSTEQVR